jgi:restriction endonuclease
MKEKLNREEYQERCSRRIQIIEPVFADISYCKGLNRFTLRGKEKANEQWQLYCIAHNLGKCLNKYNKRKGLVQGNRKRGGEVKRAA